MSHSADSLTPEAQHQHPQSSLRDAGAPGGAPARDERHARRPHAEAPRGLALDAPAPSPLLDPEIPEERLDADAIRVIARLRHVGHQAFFVGGCVRDVLLDKKPKDFDVATSAHPGEVRAVFRNCRLIGRRFRLAHVYFRGNKVIEVATFRKNPIDAAEDLPDGGGDLLITRDNVFGTAEEDARRRDFTVNGLFYDVFAGEVIDYVGGRADLEARRIATIGDPDIRMQEDPVRALRAIRFAARLGFAIEPETFAAMRRYAPDLARCAAPRLLEETFKILRCGASARAFELLRSSGALPVVLPAIASFHEAADEAQRRRFAAHLAALDELVHGGGDPSEAVLLGALLLHLPVSEGGAGSADRERLLSDLVTTARLPRRIAERTRLAMSSQRTFHGHARRRRSGISTQSYFHDALQLLEMTVKATGEGADLLERWSAEHHGRPHHVHAERAERHGEDRRRESDAHGGRSPGRNPPRDGRPVEAETGARAKDPDASLRGAGPAAQDGQGEPRRRRRHRGGRRRRRRGGGGHAETRAEPPSKTPVSG